MLQEMRKYSKGVVSSIFLGVLALSFVVWGVADIFRGSTDTNVFTLGSTAVPIEDFRQEYQDAMRSAGVVLPPDQAKAMAQRTLDTMTLRTALDNLAGKLGLTITDARLQQQIQTIGAFSGINGSFDHDKFVAVINQHGYTEAGFIARSRQDAARSQLIRGVEGGFQLPPDYMRAIFGYIEERRAAEFVTVTGDSVGPVPPPSDAALTAYVKAHPDSFSTPEYRAVSYAGITVADLAPSMVPTEAQIQNEIDRNRAAYIKPEKRELEQIHFDSQAEAMAAKAEIDRGKTFAQIAADRKLKDTDWKTGDVVQADLDAARAGPFFALPPNGVSAPVKSTFGWVLMHVGKITPGSTTSHDDIKAIVQKQLALDKITDMTNAFTEAVNRGDSIQEAAQSSRLHYSHINAIDAQGLAPDGSKALDPANPELLAAIFKAEVGEDGEPFQTQDGSTFSLRVDGVTPPKLKPLDAVRPLALSRWMAEQRLAMLKAKALALAARANQEHSLAGVAKALGAPMQASPSLDRNTNSEPFSARITSAIFLAPPGGAVAAPSGPDSYIIARVTGVVHPAPPEGSLTYLQGAQQLGGEVASDITITLAKAIQNREKLRINQKLIDSTVGNSGSGQ
ncbi:MAG TPA: peptidyl-prolyl cis-trans isomerase [Rhizomicrobium sp.]|nr:peptidyl-prolyl cis-trans isomerase [Rhizomicrobium sp.]